MMDFGPVLILGLFAAFGIAALVSTILSERRARRRANKRSVIPTLPEDYVHTIKKENKGTYECCVVCWEEETDTLFDPCSHICCCRKCAVKLDECPLCRKEIQGLYKTA